MHFKKSPIQVFSCEYVEIFKNSFFYRTPQVTASVLWTITILNYNHALENLGTMNGFDFTFFFSDSDVMLYRRHQLLLLSQSGLKQLLSESLTDKFH